MSGRDINPYYLKMFRSLGQGLGSRKPRSFSQWHLCGHLAVSIPLHLGEHRRGLCAQAHWGDLKWAWFHEGAESFWPHRFSLVAHA